jgi:dUTP pyrophosphatase
MMNSLLEQMRQPKMVFEKIHPNAQLPKRAHPNDEGWDLFAVEEQTIEAKSSAIIKVGLKLAFLDDGYWIKVESRSGLAFKSDIVAHQGVIDAGYRGELGVKLFNFSNIPYDVKVGDRVCQIAVKYSITNFGVEWGKTVPTQRGSNGFGSTGK